MCHPRSTLPIDSDEVLVARARAGVEGAFAVLLTRYQKQLYQIAHRGARGSADAEEITHAILTCAYRDLGAFDLETSFRAWLYGIAAREIAERDGFYVTRSEAPLLSKHRSGTSLSARRSRVASTNAPVIGS